MSQPPVLLGSAHLRVTEFSVISVGLKLSGGPGLSVEEIKHVRNIRIAYLDFHTVLLVQEFVTYQSQPL